MYGLLWITKRDVNFAWTLVKLVRVNARFYSYRERESASVHQVYESREEEAKRRGVTIVSPVEPSGTK